MLAKSCQALEQGIRKVEKILSTISGFLLVGLMVLGAADVIGRYVFNRPIMGTFEISEILMAVMVFLGWAYTQAQRGHIRVDLLVSRYPPRLQAMVEFVILFLVLVVFCLIAWKAASIARQEWQEQRLVSTILIPRAFFTPFVTLGAFALCVELIIQMIHLLPKMRTKKGV